MKRKKPTGLTGKLAFVYFSAYSYSKMTYPQGRGANRIPNKLPRPDRFAWTVGPFGDQIVRQAWPDPVSPGDQIGIRTSQALRGQLLAKQAAWQSKVRLKTTIKPLVYKSWHDRHTQWCLVLSVTDLWYFFFIAENFLREWLQRCIYNMSSGTGLPFHLSSILKAIQPSVPTLADR